MTSPRASIAVYNRTLALSDQLRLEPAEIVAFGLSHAAAHMDSAGLRPEDLRATLDRYLSEAEKVEVANDR